MKLKHPDTDVVIETTEDFAETYASQGWVADDDQNEDKTAPKRGAKS